MNQSQINGFHLCRFVNECQQLADQCEAWL